MASQREIRRRIASVRNIKQITRAMQFVAASQAQARPGRDARGRGPYSEKLDEVLADLAAVLGGEDHPLLARARGRQAPDRAGHHRPRPGRLAQHQHDPLRRPRDHRAPGRPGGRDRRPQGPRRDAPRPRADRRPLRRASATGPAFGDVLPLARLVTDDYLAGTYGRGRHHLPGFVSTLVQRPIVERLLPDRADEDTEGIPGHQFIFEPDRPTPCSSQLLPRYVATRLFQAVLEVTRERGVGRMVAMKNATENAAGAHRGPDAHATTRFARPTSPAR